MLFRSTSITTRASFGQYVKDVKSLGDTSGDLFVGLVGTAPHHDLEHPVARPVTGTVDECHQVRLHGTQVHLTPTEFKLLAKLVRQAGQVVTHRALLLDVWGPEHTDQVQYLRLFMGQLRAKLEPIPAEPRWLLTEPGIGYRLCEPSSEQGRVD